MKTELKKYILMLTNEKLPIQYANKQTFVMKFNIFIPVSISQYRQTLAQSVNQYKKISSAIRNHDDGYKHMFIDIPYIVYDNKKN